MQIIRQSKTELVLRRRQFSSSIAIFALGFTGIPLVMASGLLGLAGRVELSCERIEPTLVDCQSTKTPMLGIFPTTTQKYEAVTAVEYKVEERVNSEGERRQSHYVILTARQGEVSVLQRSISAASARNIANTLNQFLQSDRQSISFEQDTVEHVTLFSTLGFLSIFIATGVAVAHSQMRITTLKIDKSRDLISKSDLSILGLWTKSASLSEIQKIEVEKSAPDSDGDRFFKPVIVMRSGKKYTLGNATMNQESAPREVANRVRSFLNLPPLPTDEEES